MKFLRTQLLEPADTDFPRLETVILESTYGGRADVLGSRRDAEMRLINKINETIKRGGKVLVPVLGVGRAQEVMMIVHKAVREGLIQPVPIYVQGMVWDITAIHTAYPDYLNRDLRKSIFHKDQNPFMSEIFKKVGSRKEQEQIMEGGPCLILATSGMLNGGASLEYFKQMADNPKNTIVFVSYVGEGTIGRKVQNGDKTIMLLGAQKPETIYVNLEVAIISDLTGHAGRNELLRFVHQLSPKPKRVIVNHGEASKCLELASSLHKINSIETYAPRNLETIRLR
jgi:predicted metal-dependent RNase